MKLGPVEIAKNNDGTMYIGRTREVDAVQTPTKKTRHRFQKDAKVWWHDTVPAIVEKHGEKKGMYHIKAGVVVSDGKGKLTILNTRRLVVGVSQLKSRNDLMFKGLD